MNAEYALVLLSIVIVPLILSRDRHLRLYGRGKALGMTILIVCVAFWAWDIVATARGHWTFNDDHVLGLYLLGMPIEEWLFFVVLSFVSIFSWESAKVLWARRR